VRKRSGLLSAGAPATCKRIARDEHMTKILFVQGMNTRRIPDRVFQDKYFAALRELLARTMHESSELAELPKPDEVRVLSWVDLVPNGPRPGSHEGVPALPPTKGPAQDLEDRVYDYLRQRVLALDKNAVYDLQKPAPSWFGRKLRPYIAQAAMYMANTPAAHVPYPDAAGALRGQVLARFAQMGAKETRVVIGHSLGTVIAYEGLCRFPHRVKLLVTVGSSIGTPRLIYDRLTESLPPYPWPNVDRWCNAYGARDVFFTPRPRLKGLFGGPVEDL